MALVVIGFTVIDKRPLATASERVLCRLFGESKYRYHETLPPDQELGNVYMALYKNEEERAEDQGAVLHAKNVKLVLVGPAREIGYISLSHERPHAQQRQEFHCNISDADYDTLLREMQAYDHRRHCNLSWMAQTTSLPLLNRLLKYRRRAFPGNLGLMSEIVMCAMNKLDTSPFHGHDPVELTLGDIYTILHNHGEWKNKLILS